MSGGVTVVSCRDPAAIKRIVDAVTFSAYTHAQLSADTLAPHVLMRLKAGGDTLLLVSEAAPTLACTPQRQVVLGVASVPASKVAATVCGCAVVDEFASAAGQLCVVQCPAAAAEDLTFVLIEPTEGGHMAQVLVEWGVQAGAAALVHACIAQLPGLNIGPVVIAQQARVALADEIGARFRARVSVMVIGERPGLSVADSLGLYLTFDPRIGRTDAERNCISNIHGAGGLGAEQAAKTLGWLLREALRRGLTGVDLKDDQALLPSSRPLEGPP
jgi:hypothetical protein